MAEYTSLQDTIYQPVAHQISTHGVAPDRPHESLGDNYLASALNFYVRDGRVQKRGGLSTIIGATAFSGTPQTLFEFSPVGAAGSAILVAAAPADFYYTTGSNWTNITTTARTGLVNFAQPIFFTTFLTASAGQWLVSVNGVDPPCRWSGSTSSAFINFTTAVVGACVTSWHAHLLQGDTTDTGDGHITTRVHWSALGDSHTWSGTASAGFLDLMSLNATRVMNLVAMRTTLLAYKEEGVHALIYKASPFYFTQVEMHGLISVVSRRAIAPIQSGDIHFVMTRDGAILWDGQSVRPIGKDRVDKTILNQINFDFRESLSCTWWPLENEVIITIPGPNSGGGAPVRCWIYSLTHDAWWEQDLSLLTVFASTTTYGGRRLIGGLSGSAFPMRLFESLADGTASAAISSSIQTGFYDYDQFNHKDIYKTHVVFGPGTGLTSTIQLSKAGQENSIVTPTFASAQSLTSTGGPGLPFVDYRLTNRWISYRITHTAASEICQVAAIIPELTPRTGRRKD